MGEKEMKDEYDRRMRTGGRRKKFIGNKKINKKQQKHIHTFSKKRYFVIRQLE
jgi:hypothetical protein